MITPTKRQLFKLGVLKILDGLLMTMSFGYWYPTMSARYTSALIINGRR